MAQQQSAQHTPEPKLWDIYLHEHVAAYGVVAGTPDGACEEYALWVREFEGEHGYRVCRSQIAAGSIVARAAITKAGGAK